LRHCGCHNRHAPLKISPLCRPLFGKSLVRNLNNGLFANQEQEKVIMKKLVVKKFDASTLISNLLIVAAAVAASAPMLLGERLVLIASGAVRQGAILLQEFSVSLQKLLS